MLLLVFTCTCCRQNPSLAAAWRHRNYVHGLRGLLLLCKSGLPSCKKIKGVMDRDEDPVLAKNKTDPGLCTSIEGRFFKSLLNEYFR